MDVHLFNHLLVVGKSLCTVINENVHTITRETTTTVIDQNRTTEKTGKIKLFRRSAVAKTNSVSTSSSHSTNVNTFPSTAATAATSTVPSKSSESSNATNAANPFTTAVYGIASPYAATIRQPASYSRTRKENQHHLRFQSTTDNSTKSQQTNNTKTKTNATTTTSTTKSNSESSTESSSPMNWETTLMSIPSVKYGEGNRNTTATTTQKTKKAASRTSLPSTSLASSSSSSSSYALAWYWDSNGQWVAYDGLRNQQISSLAIGESMSTMFSQNIHTITRETATTGFELKIKTGKRWRIQLFRREREREQRQATKNLNNENQNDTNSDSESESETTYRIKSSKAFTATAEAAAAGVSARSKGSRSDSRFQAPQVSRSQLQFQSQPQRAGVATSSSSSSSSLKTATRGGRWYWNNGRKWAAYDKLLSEKISRLAIGESFWTVFGENGYTIKRKTKTTGIQTNNVTGFGRKIQLLKPVRSPANGAAVSSNLSRQFNQLQQQQRRPAVVKPAKTAKPAKATPNQTHKVIGQDAFQFSTENSSHQQTQHSPPYRTTSRAAKTAVTSVKSVPSSSSPNQKKNTNTFSSLN